MKTIEKKQYVTPKLDVVLVELEEGIAQTSTVLGNPTIDDHGTGTGHSGWSDDSQF